MDDGFVYFAHAYRWDQLLYKVGFSKNPTWRIEQLSTKASPLCAIAIVPGPIEAEQALHEMLKAYQVFNEWYRIGRRVHRIISYCRDNGELPPCVLEAGQKWLSVRDAKREYQTSLRRAGEFFQEDEHFGLTRETDPFPIGKKFDRNSIIWTEFAEPLPKGNKP